MANFLQSLFGTSTSAGFIGRLFGGGKPTTAEPKSPSFLPKLQSRFPAGFLEEVFPEVYKPPVAELLAPPTEGTLPPPRALETLTPEQIPVVVEEDFLEPTAARPATEPAPADELAGFDEKTQHWLRSGEWLYVFSSNVSALRYLWGGNNALPIHYRDSLETLQIEYLDGSVYEYYRVPPKIAVDFSYALSPGRFRWRVLGDPRWRNVQYDYKRIKEGRKGARPKARVARFLPEGRKSFL